MADIGGASGVGNAFASAQMRNTTATQNDNDGRGSIGSDAKSSGFRGFDKAPPPPPPKTVMQDRESALTTAKPTGLKEPPPLPMKPTDLGAAMRGATPPPLPARNDIALQRGSGHAGTGETIRFNTNLLMVTDPDAMVEDPASYARFSTGTIGSDLTRDSRDWAAEVRTDSFVLDKTADEMRAAVDNPVASDALAGIKPKAEVEFEKNFEKVRRQNEADIQSLIKPKGFFAGLASTIGNMIRR
ncbi:MAG: hypothetical protein AAF801_19210 [Pseudomonadota bacterium]